MDYIILNFAKPNPTKKPLTEDQRLIIFNIETA